MLFGNRSGGGGEFVVCLVGGGSDGIVSTFRLTVCGGLLPLTWSGHVGSIHGFFQFLVVVVAVDDGAIRTVLRGSFAAGGATRP